LAKVDRKPEQPEPVRQVILCGLRLGENGSAQASEVLTKWTGQQLASAASWEATMSNWQEWFQKEHPDQPAATLPKETAENRWTVDEIVTFLASTEGLAGNRERGLAIFDKATCVKCHRFGNRGDGVGPDLSTVSQRFQRREIVESVIHPSHVISDQYASKTVQTERGMQFTGIVGEAGVGAVVVLQPNGEKVTVPRNEIAQIFPSAKSAMPEGLFNTLTLEEIADLFAYLSAPPGKSNAVAEGVDKTRVKVRQR
jgi:putative heme-binding domain-containing protein